MFCIHVKQMILTKITDTNKTQQCLKTNSTVNKHKAHVGVMLLRLPG